MKKVEYAFHEDWVPLAMKNLFLEEWDTDDRDTLVDHEEPVDTYDRIKLLFDKGYLSKYIQQKVDFCLKHGYDVSKLRQFNDDFENEHEDVSADDVYFMGRVFWEYQDLLPYKIV